MTVKKVLGWGLMVLGFVTIFFQSWLGCKTWFLGPVPMKVSYSIPCISISVVIGLALVIAGIFLLKNAK